LGEGSTPPAQAQASAPAAELYATFERELDLVRYPILRAHVLDGRAVLPMALTVEWLAHAAMHGNPGRAFHGLDNLKIFEPVTVGDGRAATVRALAGRAIAAGELFRGPGE